MAETKAAKPKLIEVKVIGSNANASLVQYYDKTRGAIRVTIPNESLVDGKVSLDELEMGVPYGVAWEKLDVKPITAVSFAKSLRDEGIFTKQDIIEKRTAALTAINRLSGLLLKDIFEQI